jgi:short-subunit dehydrogenase
MDSLGGKVVIITGASQGIGAHLAAALRARRSKLVLTARNEAALRTSAGPADLIVTGDLTTEATRLSIVERTIERFGRIDVLINNAGRGSYYLPSAAPLEDARSLFELNFFAPFHLAQLATPFLLRTGGTIVNVSSIAGQMTLPWLPLYSASKFALTSLSASQRMELRRQGVHVMTVFPGYVDTDFQAHATGDAPPPGVVKGKRFAVSAEDCSAAIVRGIELRSREVVTPRMGWLAIWANRLVPGLVESRMERIRCISS